MLTAPEIEDAKPGKHYDSRGLFLFVTANGVRSWRWRYRVRLDNGRMREREVVLGRWPAMKLTDAREARDKQHELLRAGRDPATAKQRDKRERRHAVIAEQDNTFRNIALQWYANRAELWRDSYAGNVLSRLQTYLFPPLGAIPIRDLEPHMILTALEAIKAREVAHRCRKYVSAICRYAVARRWLTSDPARDLSDALKPMAEQKQRPALIERTPFGGLLNAIDGYSGRDELRIALQIIALTVPRPGELRKAKWGRVRGAEWIIPASDAKQNREHVIFLSRQARALFDELREMAKDTGDAAPIWPGMSENALSYALAKIGYAGDVHCPHGFRASFSSIMAQQKLAPEDITERCLAHLVGGDVSRRYQRYAKKAERKQAMQKWADECDRLRALAKTHAKITA
ncbi:MAG: integrase arm-type DNA-binding domain-containing protein [Pseudomonadota bacterium]